ncbi:MAG: hypothetical protein CMG00_05735 [Candidatus Marinimicrobia bacterium]|nr:hypothetical protein [Candidatus Neomarinimicrobiota bacterium]|tara:strand:- start:1483 stop:3339 length:1857 start_codon:yes stop_codon:yes gene_type:complete
MFGRFIAISFFIFSFVNASHLTFAEIPIQEDGRIKPLESFAKNQLLRFYGKSSISKMNLSAMDWLFGVLTNDQKIIELPIFNIRNPEVADALGLERANKHKYSYSAIQESIRLNLQLFDDISKKPEEQYSLVEKQLVEVYTNVILFSELKSSFSCLVPLISVDNPVIANRMGVELGDKISFLSFVRNIVKFSDLIDSVSTLDKSNWGDVEIQFYNNLRQMDDIYEKRSTSLKIIPLPPNYDSMEWISPWELVDKREIHNTSIDLLIHMQDYIKASSYFDDALKQRSMHAYQKTLYESSDIVPEIATLKREVWYNNSSLFYKSTALYILSFFMICISLLLWRNLFIKISIISLISGFALHGYGLYLRMVIMQRPPVTTIYESIIFVGFICVLCAIIFEYIRKDGLGVLVGSLAGLIFHYVAFGYAADGDTLGVLVAVLNSNFWLATHVTTITTGYGVSIVAGIMGHILLVYTIINPENRIKIKEIYNNTFGITLMALFFTLFGTILGGIWADQSWGRFWGWDPKENGALLICMWQIFMIHMRLTGMVKSNGFAFGMIINNIIVVMAWFGVNLLSVGLHSYGFVSGIALNLALFTSFEIVTGVVTYFWATKRQAITRFSK